MEDVRGYLRQLTHVAGKASESGFQAKVSKYTNLNVHTGVAPLVLSAWGLEGSSAIAMVRLRVGC